MNTTVYYMCLYAFTVLVCLIGAYLHLVSVDTLTVALGLVLGHGTGLFTPAPDGSTITITKPSVTNG